MSATVTVSLKDHRYPIYIEAGLLSRAGEVIRETCGDHTVCLITDQTVGGLYGDTLAKDLNARVYTIPPGEGSKSFSLYYRLCEDILKDGIDRNTIIVALGGGVVGDLAGFVAATLLRGLSFVQIPTTLLAQVDSSVGGKTGINGTAGKNLIGAFHQPEVVLIDPETLASLSEAQMLSGYAEVVKYGLIRDADFFTWLEENSPNVLAKEPEALATAITKSCTHKAAVVAEDEKEQTGARALLNLGHTFGHGIEAAAQFNIPHGHCVAVGMALAFELSVSLGQCEGADHGKVLAHLRGIGLPTELEDLLHFMPDFDVSLGELVALMHKDKKAEEGQLTLILARKIGAAFVQKDVPELSVKNLLSMHFPTPEEGVT